MQANSKHKNMEEGPGVKDRHETQQVRETWPG